MSEADIVDVGLGVGRLVPSSEVLQLSGDVQLVAPNSLTCVAWLVVIVAALRCMWIAQNWAYKPPHTCREPP